MKTWNWVQRIDLGPYRASNPSKPTRPCNFRSAAFARLAPLLLLIAVAARAGEPSTFTLAGLKLLPTPWDKEANLAKLERYARKAVDGGADFVVTPEGYLEGYVGNTKFTKDLTPEKYLEVGELIDGPMLGRVAELARELKIYLLIGFAERRGERMYNSAVIFSPQGERIAHYSKTHNGRIEPYNVDGSEFPVFPTPIGRLGMLICYDRQLPETSRILAIKGAEIILVPAFGLGIEKINEDIMMRTRAYENSVYVAHVHPKNTFIVDPKGNIVAQQEGEDEGIVMAEIVLDERIGAGTIQTRRPEIYGEILGRER